MSFSPSTDLLHEALALHRRGARAQAAARYAEVLRRDPGNADAHYYLAMMSCQDGHFAEGVERARKALANDPQHARAYVILGRALNGLGHHDEALASFEEAIALAPDLAQAYASRADVLSDSGRFAEAIESYDKALALAPEAAEDWFNRAVALSALERREESAASFDKAIEGKPHFAAAHLGRAGVLCDLRRYEEALAAVTEALRMDPSRAEAWLVRARVLRDLKRYDETLAAYDSVLALKPSLVEAWLGRAAVLFAQKRHQDALLSYEKALHFRPDLPGAWLGRGNVLFELRNYDDALAAYDQAVMLQADFAEGWTGRGNALNELQRHDEAYVAFERAVALKPDLAEAWLGRGNVCTALKRYDDASAAYVRVLKRNPDLAEAWLGRGNVLFNLKRYAEARAAYNRAIVAKSDLGEAWQGCGLVSVHLKDYETVLASFDRALGLKPDLRYGMGDRLHAKLKLCDWKNLDAEILELEAAVRAQKPATAPFQFLALSSSAAAQLHCTKRFMAEQPTFPTIWRREIYTHDRIRIGYFSADFCSHAVAQLAVGLFEQHDKSLFQATAISFGPDDGSDMRSRIKSAFEDFVDVHAWSDVEVAEFIRRREIDIVVDLTGLTGDTRSIVLAHRVAPVQVNFLGYPGTMGARFIDYIIADPTIIPEDHFPFYSEQVVWLPDSYQPNDDKKPISARKPTRSECGLPETAFVFCCFNSTYKITPEVFDVWTRLLAGRDNSVLWLIGTNPTAENNLRREAGKRAISSDRLIFAPKMPLADHLARSRQADLFLDTVPYNAHTTGSDALWAGVPLLTCLGSTFAGRVAASLLKAVGLDDLITSSLQDYEALALKLANDPSALHALRERLARNRTTHPLFDTKRFTRHIEAAYARMWQLYQKGEAAKAFAVNRIE